MNESTSWPRLSLWTLPALMALATPLQAQDLAAGRSMAASACAVCHGPMGLASQPGVPHLAGQPQSYLVEQLKNYRSGKRPHEVMAVIARPLSNTEIEEVSLWYASLAIKLDQP